MNQDVRLVVIEVRPVFLGTQRRVPIIRMMTMVGRTTRIRRVGKGMGQRAGARGQP